MELSLVLWDDLNGKEVQTPWTVAHQAPLSMGFTRPRILGWVAIPFSRGSSQPRDRTRVSCIVGRFFIIWAHQGSPHKEEGICVNI